MLNRRLLGVALAICLLCTALSGCKLLRRPATDLHPPIVLNNPENPEGSAAYPDSGLPIVPPALPLPATTGQGSFAIAMAGFYIDMGWLAPGPAHNVQKAADLLDGTILQPGEVFSFNDRIGPYSRERGWQEGAAYSQGEVISSFGGGVCKVATTLYNVAVLADLQVLERRNHGLPVPYVKAGQDATVNEGGPDLKFQNSYIHPVLLKATVQGSKLLMAVYGSDNPPQITWEHHSLGNTEPPVVYKDTPDLPPGEERLAREGMAGSSVQSWLIIRHDNGRAERRNMGVSTYAPLAQIVERGVTVTTDEALPPAETEPSPEAPQLEQQAPNTPTDPR